MISNYEIRENSLTQNSVYILLLKADEQGRKDIERELSEYCKLLNEKVSGFDYVFELSGITEESLLEKIRTRIDFLSASISGITQTFGNLSKTTCSSKIPAFVKLESSSKYPISLTKSFLPKHNGRIAGGAGGRMDADDLAHRGGLQSEGIIVAKVLLGRVG